MASKMRYIGGDCKPRLLKTSTSYPIEEGDLVYYDAKADCAKPASSLADAGSADENQKAFAAVFAGVAMAKVGLQSGEWSFNRTTDPGYIQIGTAGLWRFDCDAYQWTPGEEVGVYADTDGCQDQKVLAAITSQDGAIGVAVPGVPGLTNTLTEVVVDIVSTLFNQGIQAYGSGQ